MAASKELAARVGRNHAAYSPSPKRDTTLHLRALAAALDGLETYEDKILEAESAALVATRVLSFLCFEKHGRAYNRGEEKVTTSQIISDVKIITLKHRAHEGKVVYVGSEAMAARIKAAAGDNAKRELVNQYLAKPKNGEKRQLVNAIKVPFTVMAKVYEYLIANFAEEAKTIAAMEDAQAQMDAYATLMQSAFGYEEEALTFAQLRAFFEAAREPKPEQTNVRRIAAIASKVTDIAELEAMAQALLDRIDEVRRMNATLDAGDGEEAETAPETAELEAA